MQSLGAGGLEAMATNLAIALHERGIRSQIVSLGDGGVLEDRLLAAKVPYHLLRDGRWRSLHTHRELRRIFLGARATVVHTHHFASLLTSALPARFASVRRLVHTEHAWQYLEPSPALRRVLPLLSRAASTFALVGDEMRPYYRDTIGVPDHRIRIVRNGIDTDRFRPSVDRATARRKLGLPHGVLVGTAGRFAAVKNFPLLLRAVARARATVPDLILVMIGDGAERAALEDLAVSLELGDAIRFLGWRTDTPAVLAALDIFALTSFSEGLPLVVLEAMASGLPTVTTAVGDLPRVVSNGETGYTVPSDDEDALTAALVRLGSDTDARRRMGARAREVAVARFGQDAMVSAYLREYGVEAS